MISMKRVIWTIVLFAPFFSSQIVEAQQADPLAVPTVELDRYGLFTVEDCPTTHEVLEVTLQDGEYSIDKVMIYADGMLMQSVSIGDVGVTRHVVHFLDANFDGNVDILVGPGCNREYSALIMWDREENKFVRASNDGFTVFNGDFFYEPGRMAVYRRTSSSAFETTYTMMTWQGCDLQSEETFLQIAPVRYEDYHVTHRYTVRNYFSDEDIISTDDPNELFDPWDKWVITSDNVEE